MQNRNTGNNAPKTRASAPKNTRSSAPKVATATSRSTDRLGQAGGSTQRQTTPRVTNTGKPVAAAQSKAVDFKKMIIIGAACLLAVVLLFVVLAAAGVFGSKGNKDGDYGNGGGGPGGGGTGPISGDTSPDGVEKRIRNAFSKEAYESQFPARFGSDKWKSFWKEWDYYADPNQGGPVSKYGDYYSYENLIKAARMVAGRKLKIQTRIDAVYGELAGTAQTTSIDKATGKETVMPGADFDAEWNLQKPIKTVEVDLGSFMLAKDPKDSLRDLAAFLANMSHETGGGDLPDIGLARLETGLFFNEETIYLNWDSDPNNLTLGYIDSESTAYPAQPGQSYHGRGPVQLSYNYNYGLISGILFGDKMVLLKNPDLILEQDELGFATGLLFWMTPQPPKASCSQVMTKTYVLTDKDIQEGRKLCFGLTIIIFNGGLEGNLDESDGRISRRTSFYRKYTTAWNIDITGEQLDTVGMGKWE